MVGANEPLVFLQISESSRGRTRASLRKNNKQTPTREEKYRDAGKAREPVLLLGMAYTD